MKRHLLFFLMFGLFAQGWAQYYYPPTDGSEEWETLEPLSIGFCQEKIDSLYSFLESTNTRGFILLKEGRIILEEYFNGHTQDSFWYWASAGKSLTAYMMGIAQSEGLLDIEQPSSDFLGLGWTVEPPEKEILINLRHHLSMSTGIADNDDLSCLQPECLEYYVDAGERWSYMSQGSRLLNDVLEEAYGSTLNALTSDIIGGPIGMGGFWLDYVRYSKTRDMARFGLLALSDGVWDGDSLISDQGYLQAMTSSSQDLNLSYGYLWWLNGQESHMLPGLEFVLPFELISTAPADMYAALGKNDQKIYVIPSMDMVVVRTGDPGQEIQLGPSGYDTDLWAYISDLACEPLGIVDYNTTSSTVYPNPAKDVLIIRKAHSLREWSIRDHTGRVVLNGSVVQVADPNPTIDISYLSPGSYLLVVHGSDGTESFHFFKE